MKTSEVQVLTDTFEAHAQQTENGVDYWLARDLQHLLGYAEWRNFSSTTVAKAKTACEVSDHAVSDHFVDVNKMSSWAPEAGAGVADTTSSRLEGARAVTASRSAAAAGGW